MSSKDPVFRRWEHQHLTFSMLYAFNENFILPFSHDEVVHGKGSMMTKMPGDVWQKAATLRVLYTFMYAHPGKKLLFMGSEFGQWREWNHDDSLRLASDGRAAASRVCSGSSRISIAFYRDEPALHEVDFEAAGIRMDRLQRQRVERDLAHPPRSRSRGLGRSSRLNWTPLVRYGYRIGVPEPGYYEERLNSDASLYGGSNVGNQGGVASEPIPAHGRPHSVKLTLPPLAGVILKKTSGT